MRCSCCIAVSSGSLYLRYRLPFDMWIPPPSQLPTEIWERIIDWIGADSETRESRYLNETLRACTLVCRSWLHRAWLNLYRAFQIWPRCIPRFLAILRNNPRLSLSSTKSIVIGLQLDSGYGQLSALFTTTKVTNLKYLEIPFLELTQEHSVITRGPLSRTVTSLNLWGTQPCSIATFLRFLNSFRSLKNLRLDFDTSLSLERCDILSYSGQTLPRPHPIPGRALNSLSLPLISGIGRLIDWYIREGCFLAKLKKLRLCWDYPHQSEDDLAKSSPGLDSFRPLLGYCYHMGTLEDLTLYVDSGAKRSALIEEISAIGMFQCASYKPH